MKKYTLIYSKKKEFSNESFVAYHSFETDNLREYLLNLDRDEEVIFVFDGEVRETEDKM